MTWYTPQNIVPTTWQGNLGPSGVSEMGLILGDTQDGIVYILNPAVMHYGVMANTIQIHQIGPKGLRSGDWTAAFDGTASDGSSWNGWAEFKDEFRRKVLQYWPQPGPQFAPAIDLAVDFAHLVAELRWLHATNWMLPPAARVTPPTPGSWSNSSLPDIDATRFTVAPSNDDFSAQWKRDGLCPKCGHKGTWQNMACVCPAHGAFLG